MTSTTTTQPRPARRLGVAALASVLLGAGLATAGTPAQAAPLDADCNLATHVDATWMECSITESASLTFDDLVPEHLTPHDGTDVIMTARGGSGATIRNSPTNDLHGGAGGVARTLAAAEDIDELHVYVGRNAGRDSFEGGSATVVSEVPVTEVTSIDDAWLVAGGGGAQGARVACKGGLADKGAGSGGRGGTADANRTDGDASAAGWNGGPGRLLINCWEQNVGSYGTGGDRGVAGVNHGDPRSNGIDGVGGHGGDNGWQGNVAPDHLPGRGGVTSVYAMGGGGWGGGGGGERNGGGGGGGSYARAASTHLDLPDPYPSTPAVSTPSLVIAWPMDPPPAQVVATTDGEGTITVTRPDGTVLCDDVTRCEAVVRPGRQLVVTATPEPIADFVGFHGDCDVDGDRCTTTYQPGAQITANFHVPTVPITIQVDFPDPWTITGWVTHDGTPVCGYGTPDDRCTVQVPERAPATLTWGSQQVTAFSHWSGACTGTGPTCTIADPTTHPTITANFTQSDSGW